MTDRKHASDVATFLALLNEGITLCDREILSVCLFLARRRGQRSKVKPEGPIDHVAFLWLEAVRWADNFIMGKQQKNRWMIEISYMGLNKVLARF